MAGQRLFEMHDDIQCDVASAAGGSSLGTLAIRDTGFSVGSFQNANDDTAFLSFQMPHKKKLGTAIDSVHIHYYLPTAPTASDTVLIDYAYTWYKNGDTIPAISGWTTGTKTHTFAGTEAQYSTGIISVITNISAPSGETYSTILLVKLTRNSTGIGSDTYAADLGIIYFDAHYVTDRMGSINEISD
jgi:hypothetical protein